MMPYNRGTLQAGAQQILDYPAAELIFTHSNQLARSFVYTSLRPKMRRKMPGGRVRTNCSKSVSAALCVPLRSLRLTVFSTQSAQRYAEVAEKNALLLNFLCKAPYRDSCIGLSFRNTNRTRA